MSKWQGFDQRKICPKCGDYQTRISPRQPQPLSSSRVLFSLRRYIWVASVPIVVLLLLYLHPLNVFLPGLFFLGFVGLVIFIAYRSIYGGKGKTTNQQSREKSRIGYSLYCRSCGHAWEMTIEEWQAAGRKERENFINLPPDFPSSKNRLDEPFEKIEWKPPSPNRGIFIVTGFIGLSLIVSLLLYGVFWAKAHPQNSYAIVINGIIGAIFVLFVYTGLVVVIKPKTNKIVILLLILVMVVGLVLTALKLWLL